MLIDDLDDLIGELFGRKESTNSIGVRLFGARPNEIDGVPPSSYARVLLGGIGVFEDSPGIYGDLGQRARAHVEGVSSSSNTILEVKALGERLLPLYREAIEILERTSEEDFKAGAPDDTPSRDAIVRAVRILVVRLEKLMGLNEADAALVEVQRSVTLNVSGTQEDVDAFVAKVSALVRHEEAISLGWFADRTGIKVSQCPDGHIVILTDEGGWHTDTEITPLIKDTLGDRLLSKEEAMEYIAERKELRS